MRTAEFQFSEIKLIRSAKYYFETLSKHDGMIRRRHFRRSGLGRVHVPSRIQNSIKADFHLSCLHRERERK